MYIYIYIHIHIYIHIYIYIYIYIYIHIYVYIYVYIYIFIHIYMYIYIYKYNVYIQMYNTYKLMQYLCIDIQFLFTQRKDLILLTSALILNNLKANLLDCSLINMGPYLEVDVSLIYWRK
jgi:hypothetical protein